MSMKVGDWCDGLGVCLLDDSMALLGAKEEPKVIIATAKFANSKKH